jgi:hypothetical protein
MVGVNIPTALIEGFLSAMAWLQHLSATIVDDAPSNYLLGTI